MEYEKIVLDGSRLILKYISKIEIHIKYENKFVK